MRIALALVLSAVLGAAGLGGSAAPHARADAPGGRLVADVAAAGTPHVLDGSVYAVTQVGDTIVLGGAFARARNDSGDTAPVARANLLAFSASTGRLSTTFTPGTNGVVRTVVPAGDGTSVYVGGAFTSIGGVARQRVARVRVSDGAVIGTFDAGAVTGQVRDLALSGGRLWLAGAFTHVGGRSQAALTTVDPTTGAPSTYMSLPVAGNHGGGSTQVLKVSISPDGHQLVAVGNFDTLAGVRHHQLLTLDLTGPSAAPGALRTSFFLTPCSASFDSYMRDVDFSPDGRFFVVSTTGAYGGSTTACDTVSRFEADAAGTDVAPSWIDHTGGDTSYAVEVTEVAVYVGGHQRWWNNPFAGDRAGPGAVPREGIAALDPANGLPLSWNPGRAKGVGVFDFLVTAQGLWVASDTDRIGDFQYRGRIARLPAAGADVAAVRTPVLPDDVYSGGRTGAQGPDGTLQRRSLDDAPAAGPFPAPGPIRTAPTDGTDWNTVRGAFMVNGSLYLARSDGLVTRRSFDGTTYGAPVAVDTADRVVVLADWRADVQASTGMFFQDGRLYFTRAGSAQLFYRYFTPQSGVVGAQRYVASGAVAGFDPVAVRGMFATATHLYWAASDGALRRIGWTDRDVARVPVAGTAQVVSGPAVDGASWGARALFLYQGVDGQSSGATPTASFTHACAETSCAFDATASSSSDGGALTHAWDFGDGASGSGASTGHTYATAGTYRVTLTVRTAVGVTSSTARDVLVTSDPPADAVLVGAAAAAAHTTTHRVVVPAGVAAGDTLVLYLALAATDVPAPASPAGWVLLDAVAGDQMRGLSWTRTATAADAGATVTVTTTALVKGDLAVHAYRGSGPTGVLAHAAVVREGSSTTHATPSLLVPAAGVVSHVWVARSSVDVAWQLPVGTQQRSAVAGTGGGRLTLVGADAPVPAGASAPRTAVTTPAVSRSLVLSTVVGQV